MKNETVMMHAWGQVIVGRSLPESKLCNTYFECRQTEEDTKDSGCLCSSKRSPVKTPRKNWNISCVWWLDGQFLLSTLHPDSIHRNLFFHILLIVCLILKLMKYTSLNTSSNKKWYVTFKFLFFHSSLWGVVCRILRKCGKSKVFWILSGCSKYTASWLSKHSHMYFVV